MTKTRIITIEATYVGGKYAEMPAEKLEAILKKTFCGFRGDAPTRPDDLHIKIQDFESEKETP